MNNNIVFSILTIMADGLEQFNGTIDNLNNNLNTLDVDKTGVVIISLTISEIKFKFVKLLGDWGVMCADGSWKPFCKIPICVLKRMADIVQNVLKNK